MAPTQHDDDPWAEYDGSDQEEEQAPTSGVGSFLAGAKEPKSTPRSKPEPRERTNRAPVDEDDVPAEPTRRPWKPPRLKRFRSLDDVTKATEKMVKAYLSGDIDAEDVGAFAKLANTTISVAKAKATTAALGQDEIPDLTEQDERPDIEAVRPVMIEATNFDTMTDEERRELYEKIKSRGDAPTNGNGNGS